MAKNDGVRLVHPELPGQDIHVPERLVKGYERSGWSVAGAPDDQGQAAPEGTFLVLAKRGRDVQEWAREKGIPGTRAIYVSSVERVTGINLPSTVSLVELPGFAERDDAEAIRAAADIALSITDPSAAPAE